MTGFHLLESPDLTPPRVGFPIADDHHITKMRAAERYVPPTADGIPGQVLLNDTEVFFNVPPEAWEFRVGGYQPAFKWLDDRVGLFLTESEILHYRKMLAAMRETAKLLPKVDAAFCQMMNIEAQTEA